MSKIQPQAKFQQNQKDRPIMDFDTTLSTEFLRGYDW